MPDDAGDPHQITISVSDSDKTKSFGSIRFTAADLGEAASKTFSYTVTQSGSAGGVTSGAERFRQKHGHFPTWADAMRHCEAPVKAAWKAALLEHGVRPEELEDGPKRMDNVRQQGADEKRLP